MFDEFKKSQVFGAIDQQSIERYDRNLEAIAADIEAMEQLRDTMPHKSEVIERVLAGLRHEYQIVYRKWDV